MQHNDISILTNYNCIHVYIFIILSIMALKAIIINNIVYTQEIT